jgi:Lon protease-like protein
MANARRQPDGLNVGEVEWLADDAVTQVPPEHQDLSDALRELWPRLTEGRDTEPPRYDEALWVASRLAEILPLDILDRQHCLEMDDPVARLQLLRELIPGIGTE